jgi:protein SCO1/2
MMEISMKRVGIFAALVSAILPWAGTCAFAAAEPAAVQPAAQPDSHHLHIGADAVRRTVVQVPLGTVQLVREDGVTVNLDEALRVNRPVFVDFVYTTCTAVCPLMSATFAELQGQLVAAHSAADLISISIDPEEDTPRRLREFRVKYEAGEQWHFYTGTLDQSVAAQRAFGVFTGDKMLHQPVILFRAAPGKPWIRFDGFATPKDLYRELQPGPTSGG